MADVKDLRCAREVLAEVSVNLKAIDALYRATGRAARELTESVSESLSLDIKPDKARMVSLLERDCMLGRAEAVRDEGVRRILEDSGFKQPDARIYSDGEGVYQMVRVLSRRLTINDYDSVDFFLEGLKDLFTEAVSEISKSGADVYERPLLHVNLEEGLVVAHVSSMTLKSIGKPMKKEVEDVC